jgi:[lysine-biosynthesis-protein LysW]--L-2-aminoadipate ligase
VSRAGIAILASRVRLEEKRIFQALERRTVRYERVDARALWGQATGPAPWPVVLNREIGHARAINAARLLEATGALVVNSASAAEVCGDKWRTSVALAQAGVATPRTAIALTPRAALDALDGIGYPAVIKPLVGSWGRLVTPVPDPATAAAVLEYVAAQPSPQSRVVYVQELVDQPAGDLRVIVIGGEAIGAVRRVGRGWATEYLPQGPELAKVAVAAAGATNADIAGVDVIEDRDGRLMVIEVNHGVEFAGFQAAHGDRVDVADRIVEHLLTRAGQWCE